MEDRAASVSVCAQVNYDGADALWQRKAHRERVPCLSAFLAAYPRLGWLLRPNLHPGAAGSREGVADRALIRPPPTHFCLLWLCY